MDSSIIKDCKKAVNQAKFNPTAERKAHALKLLAKLTEAVTNLEEVKPKPKAKAKPKPKNNNDKMEVDSGKKKKGIGNVDLFIRPALKI